MSDQSRVLIRRAAYGNANLQDAVEEAFEIFAVDIAGKKVLVKPNLLSARSPEKAVTTHPAIVSAVITTLEKRGAGTIWVGDNPGLRYYGGSEEVASRTGILEAAGDYWHNLGRDPVRVRLNNPYAPEVTISREVLNCDVLISLPKMKTHTLTVITCAIKNSYGFLLGAEKARLHRVARTPRAFARTVVDVWALRPPDLVILDAVTAMQGNGPSSKDIFDYGYILASDDSVALDAVAGSLMGLRPEEIATTAEAARRRLGNADLAKITIDGPLDPIGNFKLPSTFTRNPFFTFLAGVAGGLVVSRPHVDTNACVRCGLCRDHCPTGAIKLAPFPRIDHGKCIRCYCCLEFCPYDAMKLSRRVRFVRNLGR